MTTPVKFFQEILNELKQVVWPTKTEIIRLTTVVIFISVIMGLYIGGLDYIFTEAFKAVFK